MKNYTNKTVTIIMLSLIITILLIKIFITDKPTIIENANFDAPYLGKMYKEQNIKINKNKKQLEKNNQIINYSKNFNSPIGDKNCTNKNLTSKILRENNIKVPKSYIWNNNESVQNNLNHINKELNYPLVIKATKSMQGNHVHTDIYYENEIMKYINIIKKTNNSDIIIEEQIIGNDYRITIFKGEIIGILKRIKPFVIGNGYLTLQQLVNDFNKHKKKTKKLKIISNNYIKKQNYELNSIVPKNKKVYLTNNINSNNGAGLEEIHQHLFHPLNIKLFKNISKVLKINLAGIDIISSDITNPNETYVIEVNGRPAIDNHYKINKNHIRKLLNMIF